MAADITVPRLNSNEDQVLLTDILVREGDHVKKNDVLFLLETTKTTFEVSAPQDGIVRDISLAKGSMVDVGAKMCSLLRVGEQPVATEERLVDSRTTTKITAKARLRARELGKY
jgi:pyruvate/2-oxoglutarate dehydrogenase complex dihydrolipoamide acyltransferase (E2) component